MKAYADLGHVYRCEPCIEYPGQWIVYASDAAIAHATFDAAYKHAKHLAETLDKVSVAWGASVDDPRIGQVWFTGFYVAGSFDQFGRWKD